MIVDDNLLLAYVNDALPPEQRDALEAILAEAPALRDKVNAMQVSRLPYQAAFAAQALPEMPAHLHNQIMDMIRISEAAPAAQPASRRSASDRMKLWGGWAAAVLVGIGIQAGGSALLHKPEKMGWIAQVANYQQLYVRDTVQMVKADPVASKAVMNKLYEENRIRVDIPDMSALGLQFKRVQRLAYGDRPLLQMVYLPQSGQPVALCVLPENGPDVAPHAGVSSKMQTVAWRRNGLAYVLLADNASAELPKVGALLYENKVPTWTDAKPGTENG